MKNLDKVKQKRCLRKQDPVYGDTPLHMALKNRRFGSVAKLCCYGVINPNIQNNNMDTAGHIAASYQDIGLWTKLVEIGIDFSNILDNSGMTVIQRAKRMRNGVIVNWATTLLENGDSDMIGDSPAYYPPTPHSTGKVHKK